MPDEYYFKGHNLPYTDCPPCQQAFKEQFGYNTLPKREQDTEKYRKWKLFEYEGIAKVFAYCSAKLKKIKPDLTIISCANQGGVQLLNTRLENGVAMDILAKDPNVDLCQVYGQSTVEIGKNVAFIRRFAGAFGKNKLLGSLQWLGISYHETYDPIKLWGYLFPYVMEGAKAIESYRLNYITDYPDWYAEARHAFKVMRLLEGWHVDKAQSVADTCILISRASEDWWEVRAEGMLGGNTGTARFHLPWSDEKNMGAVSKSDTGVRNRELNYERFRGMASDKCVEGLLIQNGVSYKIRYSDMLRKLGDLKQFKLIILPFSYSMSKKAFAAIKSAVESGSKLLIYNQLAPTNEYGVAYKSPLLKKLLSLPNVTYVKTNLAREGMAASVRTENAALIERLRGKTGFRFNNNGAHVVYIPRRVDDRNYLLYLANWGYSKANPVVGLPLPSGSYRLTVCSSAETGVNAALLDGKAVTSAEALKMFNVPLRPREVMLIRVQSVGK